MTTDFTMPEAEEAAVRRACISRECARPGRPRGGPRDGRPGRPREQTWCCYLSGHPI